MDYATLYVSFAWALLLRSGSGDVVVAKTDPPLLAPFLLPVVWLRRLLLINWLQDLYPEVAERLGVRFISGPVSTAMRAIRNVSLRVATANVAIGSCMAEFLLTLGIDQRSIVRIPNWCDDGTIESQDTLSNPLRREWSLDGKFVVGYSGNLGRAHEFQTLLGAAEHLRNEQDFVFLFIGAGHLTPELERDVLARGLDHMFQFRPYQDRSTLARSLSLPDVHWISLRPEMEGLIVPSKFYGIAAAGRPTIAVMPAGCEVARNVRDHEAGVVVPPGEPRALATALLRLRHDPMLLTEMGQNARRMLDLHLKGQYAWDSWLELVSGLAK